MLFPKQCIHNRYQLDTLLSEKPGRRTFLAIDLQTQTRVIIKFLLFNLGITWEEVKLFEREAEVLQCLHHKAIPPYIDRFEVTLPNAQGFAVVQAWIPAKSLKQHLENGRSFSEAEIQQIAEQLLSILHNLHTHTFPIIHRDIKPSNILLGDRSGNSVGQVYLIDFGSVQTIAAAQDGTFTVTGTYGYMPPEQFSGRTFPSSDLYSLGATVAQLLTGVDPSELLHCEKNLQLVQFKCNENLYRWLIRVLQPNPHQRFESALEALEALQEPQLCQIDRTVFQNNSRLQLTFEQENFRLLISFNSGLNFSLEAFTNLVSTLAFWMIVALIVRVLLFIPIIGNILSVVVVILLFIISLCLWDTSKQFFLRSLGKTELWRQGDSLHIRESVLNFTVQEKIYLVAEIEVIEWSKSVITAKHKASNQYVPAYLTLRSKGENKSSKISPLTDREAEAVANELGYQLQLPVQQIFFT